MVSKQAMATWFPMVHYYVDKEVPPDVETAGKAALKAFGVSSRFFHLEFFRLTEAKEGLGSVGDIVALEVNMRPCGGFSPDMMNFANSTNVYKIWADMIAFDCSTLEQGKHSFCAYAGRRDGKDFVLSHDELSLQRHHIPLLPHSLLILSQTEKLKVDKP